MRVEHIAMYAEDLERPWDFFGTYLNGRSNDVYHNPKRRIFFRHSALNFLAGQEPFWEL